MLGVCCNVPEIIYSIIAVVLQYRKWPLHRCIIAGVLLVPGYDESYRGATVPEENTCVGCLGRIGSIAPVCKVLFACHRHSNDQN